MPGPSIHEFAMMSNACYYAGDPPVSNYTRMHYGQLTSGFKASKYVLANASSLYVVVCFAGTDSDETELTDNGDKLADLGFAGPAVTTAVAAISPALSAAILAGSSRLTDQISGATEFTRQAMYFAGSAGTVYVCGHSLGGGLAQIIAASCGLQGMAFNAPTVSQLGYSVRSAEQFVNVNQRNDPVSAGTSLIGRHLGTVRTVDSGASVAQAHFLGPLIAHLGNSGGSAVGNLRPF